MKPKKTASPRGRKPRAVKGGPNAIDVHVGQRIRQRRTLLGFSQEKLGEALGLTFQQVQKYERGSNRVGASRLWHVAQVLDVPIGYFYEELPDAAAATAGSRAVLGAAEEQEAYGSDPMAKRETLELVRAYYRITNPSARRRVFDLIKAMGQDPEE